MPDYKRYAIAGATMATILLTGQVMQMTSGKKHVSAADVQAMPLPVALSDIKLTAAEEEAIVTASLDSTVSASQGAEQPKVSDACKVGMTATPMAAALVNLELSAPCAPNERVVIHHNGMMFAEVTDDAGMFTTTIPALSETSVFIASFASGEGAVANAKVEEISSFDRAVVQMQGNLGVGLHAREFGAAYGEKGHIWREAPGEIADGATGFGGFLIQLGDASLESPLMAEVYSFPSGFAKEIGSVELSVDIEITAANCNKDIEAQTLQTSRGAQITVQTLDMSMPACDAVGDFLMLKKMVNDMKVAFN
ncbi:hypothetical protein [Lentibacter sp. XHP0401]|uniref:hypothetical protein n=1 Tax=Lentibacter sp. XHP0401 TaxID=2984334 RepID=UPI0021E95192|nr:hypothetical protein [Lentibacter sp. XHP0401]MCV2892546.1 hypothetical protein [Lentibacter sp. XHP0401]